VQSRPGQTVGEETGIVKTFAGIMAVFCVGFGIMAWLSFQLPWGKKTERKAVPAPQPQPVVPAAAHPPAQVPAAPIRDTTGEEQVAHDGPPLRESELPHFDSGRVNWKFWDVFHSGVRLDQAIIVTREGVLVTSGRAKGFCLASLEAFSELNLTLDFQFLSNEVLGNPFVSVGSTLPNADGTDWTMRIPRGLEVKLDPRIAGQLILPTSTFQTKAENRDSKDLRKVHPIRTPTIRIGAWNTLECECKERTVTVTINGEIVNQLANVESTTGHIIIWPSLGEMRIRNVVVSSGGTKSQLLFDKVE
jgi:hypothetical protein